MSITVDNLTFAYNGTPVLKDITCKIAKGSFLAVAGPNGSGKSTLIKCLNGILKPGKGNIIIEGKNIRSFKLKDLASRVAYVPQNRTSYAPATVFDTVLLGRKPYFSWKPSQKDLDITARIIGQLNMDAIAMRDINKLSGGQQQLAFIARALAQEPDILLLDEPTANLDIKHAIEIMDALQLLCNDGLTVVVALHDINLGLRYASHIMMLKEGSLFAYGAGEIMTEENLKHLYGINIRIIKENGYSHVVPLGRL